jgi:PTH2 family peptidyl-tRNA hydrolase
MSSSSLSLTPLTTSLAAVALFSIGYYAGSLNKKRNPATPAAESRKSKLSDAKSSDEDEAFAQANKAELSALKAGMMEDCKMVLCVRTDLGMNKGKIAAQCSYDLLPSL